MESSNPLQQYFRRPSIYLKLPSQGQGYPEGAIDLPENLEIPIYPMTAIDEITTRTPDSLYNGMAVVELIKSCAPNIKDPWSIPLTDLDPILVAIRIATNGTFMEIDTSCPSCGESAKFDLNLTAVLNGFQAGDYSTPLSVGDLNFKFKPLQYREINETNLIQFEVQKLINTVQQTEDQELKNEKTQELLYKINEIASSIITKTIEYIQTPNSTVFEKEYIKEFLDNCDKNTFETIKDFSVKIRELSENKPLDITCSSCQHQYKQSFAINPSTFFE